MKNFPHQEISKEIIGIFYDVYNILGYGFLEKVYHRAMVLELTAKGFKIDDQKKINVIYKNQIIGDYIPDIIVEDKVIIELKAVEQLVSAHESQILNYLKATNCEVGLVLNFGQDPQFIRKIYTNNLKKH